jgi:predicted DNA-binding protein
MPENKLLQIKFKQEMWNRILKSATHDNRTITGYVRNLINKALEESKEENNANL